MYKKGVKWLSKKKKILWFFLASIDPMFVLPHIRQFKQKLAAADSNFFFCEIFVFQIWLFIFFIWALISVVYLFVEVIESISIFKNFQLIIKYKLQIAKDMISYRTVKQTHIIIEELISSKHVEKFSDRLLLPFMCLLAG